MKIIKKEINGLIIQEKLKNSLKFKFMIIISKYKDYYDYFQGIFGRDNLKIYRRNNPILFKKCDFEYTSDKYEFHVFAVNNKLYILGENKKGIFKIPNDFTENNKLYLQDKKMINEILKGKETELNKKFRKPILYKNPRWDEWESDDPILKTFQFHKIMDAKSIYLEVEAFIGWINDNPVKPDNQTNKQKITGKGFDYKKSFRHRK
ncbi:MAG: hypothetical protein GY849_02650 [Deltaproteobacteria bacterium]|nr:hypothetical protein [Deltaproteobacteria bacterium]